MNKKYTAEELDLLHAELYDILGETIRVCQKHDIPYFVIGGTAIGALYDQGILPWDDDIDIGMTRENYNKFLKVAPGELGPSYFLSWIETDPHTPVLFCQSQEKRHPFCRRNVQECPDASGHFCRYIPIRQDSRQQAAAKNTIRSTRLPQMLPDGKRNMDVETLRQMRNREPYKPGSLLLSPEQNSRLSFL